MLVSSARYMVRLPDHTPPVRVTWVGETRPSPKLVISFRPAGPVYPVTTLPLGSRAVSVVASGWPAYLCFWEMFSNVKLARTWVTADADVPSGIVLSVRSCASRLNVPAALNVTVKVRVPDWSCAGAGRVALASDEVIWMASETVLTSVHVLSHARTVMSNGMPETCARGEPVLPEGVPGAAVSPGIRTWRRVYGPARAGAA